MRSANPDATWNDATVAALKALWAEGHSTAEIGRRLGVSKNAVVGKVHRLDLPGRPSPIRRDGAARSRARRPVRANRSTLPPLACLQLPQPTIGRSATRTRPVPRVPAREPTPATLGNGCCCWPIGEPRAAGFRFCDEPNEEGRPYCPAHCARAYVRAKRAEKQTAA